MIDFPANPTTGQSFQASNGATWIWDGAKWVSGGAGSPVYLPLSGGTMTGPIIAPSGYALIDGSMARYRNRIINGDMAVDQRNGGATITVPASSYVIDRWRINLTTPVNNKGQAGQNINSGTNPPPLNFGWTNFLGWQTLTAYALTATDNAAFVQFVEGCNFNDANWGAAGAQSIVLEFWTFASLTGTFAGSLRGNGRAYVFTFNIPTASTWTKIRLNIPGDTVTGWQVAANAVALTLSLNIGSGANFQTTPGSWQTGNFISAPGAVNVLGTSGAWLYLTGVALMVGAAAQNAEPEFKKFSDNLIDCYRYFYRPAGAVLASGYSAAANNLTGQLNRPFPVTMRAVPTQNGGVPAAPVNVNPIAVQFIYASSVIWGALNTAVGGFQLGVQSDTYDADF
jgi:hypothetical protein